MTRKAPAATPPVPVPAAEPAPLHPLPATGGAFVIVDGVPVPEAAPTGQAPDETPV